MLLGNGDGSFQAARRFPDSETGGFFLGPLGDFRSARGFIRLAERNPARPGIDPYSIRELLEAQAEIRRGNVDSAGKEGTGFGK